MVLARRERAPGRVHYQDFEIAIAPGAEGSFPLRVRSPAGEGGGTLRLGPDLLPEGGSGDPVPPGPHRLLTPAGFPSEPGAGGEELRESSGEALFRSVFQGEVLSLYRRSTGMTPALRIRVVLDPGQPGAAAVQELPWEYLRDPETGDDLSLSRHTPIVRYLAVPRPPAPLPLPRRLRVLALAADPGGSRALDLSRERRNMEEALGSLHDVELTFLTSGGPEEIRHALVEAARSGQPFHVFHFMGHGSLEPGALEGSLRCEAGDGLELPVAAGDLARELRDFPELRLAFLNACESGREEPAGAATSVASALVASGLPAVVAMRAPVSDREAIAFSRAVYRSLAAGDPVDAAVAEGRLAIHRACRESLSWGVPVLFLRSPDGRLFTAPEQAPAGAGRRRAGVAAGLLVAVTATFSAGLWLTADPPGTPLAAETRFVGIGEFASTEDAGGAGRAWAATLRQGLVERLGAIRTRPPLILTRDPTAAVPGGTEVSARLYLLDGELRRGAEITLTASLRESSTGLELASMRTSVDPADGTGANVLTLQHEIAKWAVVSLGVALEPGSAELLARLPTTDSRALGLNTEGLSLVGERRFEEARDRFLAALERDPRYAAPYSNLGSVQALLGENGAALASYRRAAELLPTYPVHHYNLGNLLARRGAYEEAAESLARAIDLDPTYALAYNELGFVYLELGLLEEARRTLATGLMHAPHLPHLLKNLARVELASDEPEAAITHLQEALRSLDPTDTDLRREIRFRLAEAWEARGEAARACGHLRDLWRLDPGSHGTWAAAAAPLGARLGCPPPATGDGEP